MGYRARYIVETTRSILEGEVSLEKLYQMKYYRRARKELMKLSGVGEKVADCICLFALQYLWMHSQSIRISGRFLTNIIMRGFRTGYHGMRGIMQQYIFYYELIGEEDTEVFCKCAGGCSWSSLSGSRRIALIAVLIMCVYMLGRKQGVELR